MVCDGNIAVMSVQCWNLYRNLMAWSEQLLGAEIATFGEMQATLIINCAIIYLL
jgi:hypothetical protein